MVSLNFYVDVIFSDYGDACQFLHSHSDGTGMVPPVMNPYPLPEVAARSPTYGRPPFPGHLPSIPPPPPPPMIPNSQFVSAGPPSPSRANWSPGLASEYSPNSPESEVTRAVVAASKSGAVADFPPRKFHESFAAFTGISVEAYRASYGMPEDKNIRWDMQLMRERLLISSRESQPSVILPEIVQHKYHSLLLLDTQLSHLPNVSQLLGYKTACYKALSTHDPFAYCLRRVDGFRLSNFDLVQEAVAKWSRISHPNIVSVRQAFATGEFQDVDGSGDGGGSLVYVYDYIDLAYTLKAWHELHNSDSVDETIIWDVAMQILCALRLIHSSGLAARVVSCTKILVSPKLRIHLNCVGLLDALQHSSFGKAESVASILELQKHDLQGLGSILVSLLLGGDISIPPSDPIGAVNKILTLSQTLKSFLLACLTGEVTAAKLTEQIGYMYAFKAEQMTSAHDKMLNEMRKATEANRMMQILVKINTIADRPIEDWRWSQSSERHIVLLFRDYLFVQTDEFGRRVVDPGHVADALAKADVGSTEAIMLLDRDASSVLVVSFLEIRRCIETSFKYIASGHSQLPPSQ